MGGKKDFKFTLFFFLFSGKYVMEDLHKIGGIPGKNNKLYKL